MLLMSGSLVHQRWHRAAGAKTNVSLSVHAGRPDIRAGSLVSCGRGDGKSWVPRPKKTSSAWSRENTLMSVWFFFKRNCSHVLSPLLSSSAASMRVVFRSRSHSGSVWGSDGTDGCVLFALAARLRAALYKQLTHSTGMFFWPSFHTILLSFVML